MAKKYVYLDVDERFNIGMLEALIREAKAMGATEMAEFFFVNHGQERGMVGRFFIQWEEVS